MKRINRNEVANFFNAIKGCTAVTIEFQSVDSKVRKTSRQDRTIRNPFEGNIEKWRKYNGMVNFDYENSVNRQRGREGVEGEFKTASRSWGGHTGDNRVLIEKDGNFYIQLKLEKVVDQKYVRVDNGREIPQAELVDFLPAPRPSASRQGVERQVKPLSIAIANMIAFKAFGDEYVIVD
jgi:hypothetical protein